MEDVTIELRIGIHVHNYRSLDMAVGSASEHNRAQNAVGYEADASVWVNHGGPYWYQIDLNAEPTFRISGTDHI